MLVESWPLFGLRVVTPRLTLVVPTDDQVDELMLVAINGIHPPEEMPFGTPWTKLEPPEFQRQFLQFHWRYRAEWSSESWELPMAAIAEGTIVGSQSLGGRNFKAVRQVSTGSWLGRRYQGQGLGKEMREAILHLAFAGLGSEAAVTRAHADNLASLGVTRSLGYESNGETVEIPLGQPIRTLRYRLTRQAWERIRRPDIRLEGLERCHHMFCGR